jgi:hypothetical protein
MVERASGHERAMCAQVILAMPKSRSPVVERRGRKPLAEDQRRSRKVIASFTLAQRARLEREARDRGVSVAELVALRALGEQRG